MPMSEDEIKKQIDSYLKAMGFLYWRNNTGKHKIGNRYIRYGKNGSPDFICIINGLFVGIEVKDAAGKQSNDQKEFERQCKESQGMYFIARSLDVAVSAVNFILDTGFTCPITLPPQFEER